MLEEMMRVSPEKIMRSAPDLSTPRDSLLVEIDPKGLVLSKSSKDLFGGKSFSWNGEIFTAKGQVSLADLFGNSGNSETGESSFRGPDLSEIRDLFSSKGSLFSSSSKGSLFSSRENFLSLLKEESQPLRESDNDIEEYGMEEVEEGSQMTDGEMTGLLNAFVDVDLE